ncbi:MULTISPECIES: hypothetical protein [Corallococcus]|uniref:hypothetical protein n=1 Tax=Corallococcus TaxID=83461 RepID=UPI00117C7A85|nr:MULTISPECIES: hypothetical protein [Corallococcus]NBD09676.1 hypothetical protein [Corallococcus silvisoli]TSC24085.1 hypothetical protein FOF48_28235 [Corallococcus sp. Z5C101001]
MDSSTPRPTAVKGGLSRPGWRDLPGWLLLWGLAAVALASTCSDRRGLQGLPAGERAALFQQTSESFRALCEGPRAGDFLPRCREQARFLLGFPECDGVCRARLGPWR